MKTDTQHIFASEIIPQEVSVWEEEDISAS